MANANVIPIIITAKEDATRVLQSVAGGIQAAEGQTNRFSQSLLSLRATAGLAVAAGVAALGAAVAAAGKQAIEGAGNFEQYRVAFETMLGSADKARSLLSEISDFAKSTPFELPEIVTASKQLLAFGIEQEKIIPTMRRLGDIAAGVGVPVGQLAYVFGQVRVQGKLMGGDLMQFTNAGVPMIEGLAKVLNVTQGEVKKMVEEGKVGFPEVEKVIENMTNSGSQFGGMMDEQSKTLQGTISNIKDSFGLLLRSAVGVSNTGDIREGSIFARLKDAAEDAMPALQKAAENAGDVVSKAMTTFSLFRDVVTRVAEVVGQVLGPSLEALWATFTQRLIPSLQPFLPMLRDAAIILGGVLVAALWIAINALNIVATAASWVVNAFFTVREGVSSAIDWVVQKALWFKDNWASVIGEVIGFVATLPIKLPLLAGLAVTNMVQALISVKWSDVWSNLWNSAKQIFDKIQNAFVAVWQYVHGLAWSDIFAGIGRSIGNALIGMIEGAVRGALRGLPGNLEKRFSIPRFALGTDFAPGGAAVVGEHGPELVNLPRGAEVVPANQTRQMLAGGGRGVVIEKLNVYNNVDVDLVIRKIGFQLAA